MRRVRTIAGVLACSGGAAGQETVTFDVRFEHAVLAPGQVQTISVWALFEPGVGTQVPWNTLGGTGQLGFVEGFASAWFDLRDVDGLDTGQWSGLQIAHPLFGLPGTPQPDGSVTGILAFQFIGPTSQANPIQLWSAHWTPLGYQPRVVSVSTVATMEPEVFLDILNGLVVRDAWEPIHPDSSFTVIPAPATLLPLGAWLLMRRRRAVSMPLRLSVAP